MNSIGFIDAFERSFFLTKRVFILLPVFVLFLFPYKTFAQANLREAKTEMEKGEKQLLRAKESRQFGESKKVDQRLQQAFAHFRRAHNLAPDTTGPLLGLGLSLGHLGKCQEALPYLLSYLEKKRKDANTSAKNMKEKCEVSLQQGSYLAFQSIPNGALVKVKQGNSVQILGRTPTPTTFYTPGNYKITFRYLKKPPITKTLLLQGGENQVIQADFTKVLDPEKNNIAKKKIKYFWFGGGVLLGAVVGVTVSALFLSKSPNRGKTLWK